METSCKRGRFIASAAIILLIASSNGCAGRFSSSIPGSDRAVDSSGHGRLVFAVGSRSADNKYAIRSLHLPRVHRRQILSYITRNGVYTQSEYDTPYGELTLVQTALPTGAPPPVAKNAYRRPTDRQANSSFDITSSGTATSGGHWLVLKNREHGTYEVDVIFSDSVVVTSIPSFIPASTIGLLAGALY